MRSQITSVELWMRSRWQLRIHESVVAVVSATRQHASARRRRRPTNRSPPLRLYHRTRRLVEPGRMGHQATTGCAGWKPGSSRWRQKISPCDPLARTVRLAKWWKMMKAELCWARQRPSTTSSRPRCDNQALWPSVKRGARQNKGARSSPDIAPPSETRLSPAACC